MRIDLSDIVNSEEFQEPIVLKTNAVTVNNYGESVVTGTTKTIMAVVTNTGDKYLLKPEFQGYEDVIEVTSTAGLNGLRAGYNADEILYHGMNYRILTIEDDSSFGFMSCIAGSLKSV